MSKTYRSMFLICGSCKLQVDSDARCCKHCGRTIWLKDVSEAPKPPTENVEALVDNLQRAKIQNELEKWLPVIFPDYYYVAPSPMPKQILDFLVQHMGKERTYNMNILGYGFDSLNNRFFVFDNNAIYYKSLTGDDVLHQVTYSSIKELTVGNKQLTIKTDTVGTKSLLAFRERDLAALLAAITGASVKQSEINCATNVVENVNRAMANMEKPVVGNLTGEQDAPVIIKQPENKQSTEIPPQKTNYTVNDYIRANGGCFMALMMLATLVARVCLAVQGYFSFGMYSRTLSFGAFICAILFAGFAFLINYYQWWIMVLTWIFCVVVADNWELGTTWFPSEWYESSLLYLTIALICRFIIGIRYKMDVKDDQMIADNTRNKAQKTGYTIKEYIRNNKTIFMSLIVFGAKFCLMMQGYSTYCYGEYRMDMKYMYCGLILCVFAFLISDCHLGIAVICWLYCVFVPSEGVPAELDWNTLAVIFLSVVLICRYTLGRKYKEYMEQNKN